MSIDYSLFKFAKPSDKSGPEPKKREPKKPKPSREVKDKTTGQKRLVLSPIDWAKLRKKYWRDHPKVFCVGCGLEIKTWEEFSLDHREPRGMGGARRDDSWSNLRPMHLAENLEKGSKREKGNLEA